MWQLKRQQRTRTRRLLSADGHCWWQQLGECIILEQLITAHSKCVPGFKTKNLMSLGVKEGCAQTQQQSQSRQQQSHAQSAQPNLPHWQAAGSRWQSRRCSDT
jgi:hypothetical protein